MTNDEIELIDVAAIMERCAKRDAESAQIIKRALAMITDAERKMERFERRHPM